MSSFELWGYSPSSDKKVPFFTMSVYAGLPLPVESDIDKVVDLNEFLIEHPAATFFTKVHGDFFAEAGIREGDILIVDSAVEPEDGKYIIVSINGELTIKIFRHIDGVDYLESHNKQFLPVKIEPYIEFLMLGVITKIIHSL